MNKACVVFAALAFALGLVVGLIIRSDTRRPTVTGGAALLQAGTPVRVIYPDHNGDIQSVPLTVIRVEREADTSKKDHGQVWTLVIPSDALDAAWVYAEPSRR
jgi:hypothetical protein